MIVFQRQFKFQKQLIFVQIKEFPLLPDKIKIFLLPANWIKN